MERGKGIGSWSTSSFRSQTQSTGGTDAPAAAAVPQTALARNADGRLVESFGAPDTSGRYGAQIAGSSYDVVIAPGCTVQGKLELKGRALVNARVEGELSNDIELVVGEQGAIEGNLTGSSIRVFGKVKGDISCSG